MTEGLKHDVDELLRTCGADPAEPNCILATAEDRVGILAAVRVNVTDDAPEELVDALFVELRARFAAHGADADELARCTPDTADAAGKPLRYPLVSLADFEARPVAPDLVAGVLPLDALAVLVAPPAAGKSAVALAFAACVACGLPFLGRATREGFAVYVLAEGQGRFSRRTRALRILRPQLDAHLLNERLRLIVQPVPLTEPDAVRAVLRSIETLPEKPKLIVIDTLSRCFGVQRDENKQMDMGAFVAGCDALRGATGACVLVLHHVGATGERARGSTVLGGAVDVELSISMDFPTVTITNTKHKDGDGAGALHGRLVIAETPEPDEPNATGVAVVSDQTGASQPNTYGALPESQRWVLHVLRQADGDGGSTGGVLRAAPDVPGVAKRPKDPSTITRALQNLKRVELIEQVKDRYRLTTGGRNLLGSASPDAEA